MNNANIPERKFAYIFAHSAKRFVIPANKTDFMLILVCLPKSSGRVFFHHMFLSFFFRVTLRIKNRAATGRKRTCQRVELSRRKDMG